MQGIKQCDVKIPADLLAQAAERGLIVPTADGKRFYGISRIVVESLVERLKVSA